MFEIYWTPRARRQAHAIQRWWIENRDLPLRFSQELARLLELLQVTPEIGILVKDRDVRRILLPDAAEFVFYRVRPRARRIEILAIWGAARERSPPLPKR
jgi:plasmid stabilization system protein ParE